MLSAAGRPTVGQARTRRHTCGVVLCLSLVAGMLFLPITSANAASFVVTNIDDQGQGSLRQAILDANANLGADDITFAIPASGAQTISPQSPLPAITEQVSIDATTQPGAGCDVWPPTLLIRLEGSGAVSNPPGQPVAGLTVAAGSERSSRDSSSGGSPVPASRSPHRPPRRRSRATRSARPLTAPRRSASRGRASQRSAPIPARRRRPRSPTTSS